MNANTASELMALFVCQPPSLRCFAAMYSSPRSIEALTCSTTFGSVFGEVTSRKSALSDFGWPKTVRAAIRPIRTAHGAQRSKRRHERLPEASWSPGPVFVPLTPLRYVRGSDRRLLMNVIPAVLGRRSTRAHDTALPCPFQYD